MARLLPNTDPVHKVTIIPRGRAAEEIVFNTFTTGAGNDIERATDLARRMICEWGMSEVFGPVAFGKKEEQIFLGREMANSEEYSEDTAQEIDKEVRTIVNGQYALAKKLLLEKRDALDRLAENLLEYESLDGEEIERLIQGLDVERKKPERRRLTTPEEMSARVAKKKEEKKRGDGRPGLLDPTPEPTGS